MLRGNWRHRAIFHLSMSFSYEAERLEHEIGCWTETIDYPDDDNFMVLPNDIWQAAKNNGKFSIGSDRLQLTANLLESEFGGRRCAVINLLNRPDLIVKTCVVEKYLPDKGRYKLYLKYQKRLGLWVQRTSNAVIELPMLWILHNLPDWQVYPS